MNELDTYISLKYEPVRYTIEYLEEIPIEILEKVHERLFGEPRQVLFNAEIRIDIYSVFGAYDNFSIESLILQEAKRYHEKQRD
jgi:hypothetical protein